MNVLIIPVYTRTEWDVSCLTRLVSRTQLDTGINRVVVIDDCSPRRFDLVSSTEVIRLGRNRGPAHARNVGIKRALELGATHILMTDHDCIPTPGWASSFRSFLMRSNFAVASGITKSAGSTLLDRYHELNGTLNGRWLLPHREELLYAPTCNFAIRAEVAHEFRFDEQFPTAAGEDVDFCLRLREKFRIGLCREAVVLHDFGYASTFRGFTRFVQTFMKYKAANALLWDNHSGINWNDSESISSRGLS